MNIFKLINARIIAVFVCAMATIYAFSVFLTYADKEELKVALASINLVSSKAEENEVLDLASELGKESNVTRRILVYDGMTMSELAQKLNKSMKSTISGKGELLASYCIEKGVDPYLALSIILLETGCNWTCSSLTNKCNNVGGMKGSPGCDGGSYKAFATLDDGIKAFVDNLANNYYAYGLNTPELMNKKYAESTTWAMKVRNYMSSVQAK